MALLRRTPTWALFVAMLALGGVAGAYFGLRDRGQEPRRPQVERPRPEPHEAAPRPRTIATPEIPPPLPPEVPPPIAPEAPPATPEAPPAAPERPVTPPPPTRPEPPIAAPSRPPVRPSPTKVARPPVKTVPAKIARPTPPPRTPTKAPPTKTVPTKAPSGGARTGTLQIVCASRCDVRIDGAPASAAGVRVSEGSHTVVVTDRASGASRTLRVFVPAGVTLQRRISF